MSGFGQGQSSAGVLYSMTDGNHDVCEESAIHWRFERSIQILSSEIEQLTCCDLGGPDRDRSEN